MMSGMLLPLDRRRMRGKNALERWCAWAFAPRQCAGTMHLTGESANGGAALIGEVTYTDGCDGGKEKRGTFAVWRGPRTVASLPR
jgi:hypothetical protein